MRRPLIALLLAFGLAGCAHRPATAPARTVVITAKLIRTLDPAKPTAEALVVRDGTVAFVGDRRAALAFAGADAAVEDWPSSTVVPGLSDAHGHLASLGRALAIADLEPARDEADAVARALAAGPGAREGEWLVGRGWDQNDWPSKAFPTRAALDAAFPSTPVYLSRVDGHAAWVNGEALRRAGITRTTPDPQGGRIVRGADGEATGVLVDNAMDLAAKKIPEPSADVRAQRLKLALETCARLGLTSVHDAGMSLLTLRQLQQWDMLGVLPLRIYAMADGQDADAAEYLELGPFEGRHLELRAVKLSADGALGSRGAALHQPYSDEASHRGLLLLSPEVLEERARAFAGRGFQVAVHAIGDRANTVVLDLFERLEKAKPGSRHRIEHAQLLRAEDLPRFAKAGIIASYQPTHATSDLPWAGDRVGADRLTFAYAWRSMLDSGARVAFGSDFPVESANPLWGLYAARTRQARTGQPPQAWSPEQRVSGDEALAGYTTGAAYAAFAEHRRGVLKPGFDADFVVLPIDPVADSPTALLEAAVQVTFVGGVDVYRAAPRQ